MAQLYPSVHLSVASLVVLVITPSCHAFVDWRTCPIDYCYCNLRHLRKSVECECTQGDYRLTTLPSGPFRNAPIFVVLLQSAQC